MNQFSSLFSQRIKNFWSDASEQGKPELLKDILDYANVEPPKFKSELREIQFDKEIDPLPVVFEALSKDTDNWGAFFVEQLDEILKAAQNTRKPSEILTNLMEYAYVEKDNRPFVQQIVEKLHRAIDSENSAVRRAAIWNLPSFMNNGSIRNKSRVIAALQEKLNDRSWKTRFVAFEALRFENLLPEGYKLKLTDKALSTVLGKPYDFT